MANNRVVLCGNVDKHDLPWDDKKLMRFRMSGPHWNIRPGLPRIRKSLLREVPDRFCDLLEIATYVYVADQAATRGGKGVDNVGEDWYRNLFFRIPVREPDFWNDRQVKNTLAKALAFLSDDTFRFDFVPLVKPPQMQRYFDFGDDFCVLPQHPDLVMLFSGGLDSLAGAIQASVVDSRRVALVMHRSHEKFTRRQNKLVEALKGRAKYEPRLLPVRINKKKNLNHDFNQRTRSFLYVTLGAIFAEMFKLPEVLFYENGIVSLNLPIAEQAIGTRSSRTTHPQTLKWFTELISLIAGRRVHVHNPFMWKTKRDIVEVIKSNGFSEFIEDSISCAHAAWGLEEGKTHCGTCSQCIDRRFATLAAKVEQHDPGNLYCRDLLLDPRPKEEHKLMIASYVLTAEDIVKMQTPEEFYGRFGMACRALHCFPDRTVDAVAQEIYQLHKRHSETIMGVVKGAVARHAEGIVGREYDPQCLLRLISDTGNYDREVISEEIKKAPLQENTFKKRGHAWIIRFAGGTEFIAPPVKGIAYLQMLFSLYMLPSYRNVPCRATSMTGTILHYPEEYQMGDMTDDDGNAVEYQGAYELDHVMGNAGEVLGTEVQVVYKARKYEIETVDLPKARDEKDLQRQDELLEELEWIESELRRTGRDGKRVDKDDRNKIRNQVCNATKRAIEKHIRPYDARLAYHLQPPRLRMGYELCYMPGEDIQWDIDAPATITPAVFAKRVPKPIRRK